MQQGWGALCSFQGTALSADEARDEIEVFMFLTVVADEGEPRDST